MGMTTKTVLLETDARGVARLSLNRPTVLNALNDELIHEMTALIASVNSSPEIRVMVLTGNGRAFCAGLDVSWMEEMALAKSSDEARRLAHLLLMLKELSMPTIAAIHGPCMGGGVALASCCDVSIASDESQFALPAVHLGSEPAIVAPYIIKAIGAHQAKRYLLTGESFSAQKAREIGLVHAVSIAAHLDETVEYFLEHFLKGGPQTLANTKSLITYCEKNELNRALIDEAARRTVASRKSKEAIEGLTAFKEKRPPKWSK